MYFPKMNPVPEIAPSGGDIIIDTGTNRNVPTLEVGEGDGNDYNDYEVETVTEVEEVTTDDDKESEETLPKVTQSGRQVKIPERLIHEMNAAANDYEIMLSPAEEKYYAAMKEIGEFGLVGAGIGGGYVNTSELHVMKYDEAMTKEDINQIGTRQLAKNMIAWKITLHSKNMIGVKSQKERKL
jgi:hypothetical protein